MCHHQGQGLPWLTPGPAQGTSPLSSRGSKVPLHVTKYTWKAVSKMTAPLGSHVSCPVRRGELPKSSCGHCGNRKGKGRECLTSPHALETRFHLPFSSSGEKFGQRVTFFFPFPMGCGFCCWFLYFVWICFVVCFGFVLGFFPGVFVFSFCFCCLIFARQGPRKGQRTGRSRREPRDRSGTQLSSPAGFRSPSVLAEGSELHRVLFPTLSASTVSETNVSTNVRGYLVAVLGTVRGTAAQLLCLHKEAFKMEQTRSGASKLINKTTRTCKMTSIAEAENPHFQAATFSICFTSERCMQLSNICSSLQVWAPFQFLEAFLEPGYICEAG